MKFAGSLALAALASLAACKSDPVAGQTQDQVEVTSTVTAVNVPDRTMTLKTERGSNVMVHTAPDVKLDQVHVGDVVAVTYTATISWKVRSPEDPAPVAATQASVQKEKPGEKPSVTVGESVTVTTTITAIDIPGKTVSLTGPRGNTLVVEPRDPENLKKVKVGEHVDITYSEALAVAVRPAPKPK